MSMVFREIRRTGRETRRPQPVIRLLFTALMLAACSSVTEYRPVVNRYGALNVTARTTGATAGTARANATLIFFDALTVAVPNSALQQSDQCIISLVDTTSIISQGEKKLAVAPSLAVSGVSVPLVFSDTLKRYATSTANPFTYKAGDQLQVTIPGDADLFPTAALAVKLAEPVIPGAVTAPSTGQAMAVTWNGTNDPTASVVMALRYANPSTSPVANEQVYCVLKDDGVHEFSPVALTNFYNSPAARRTLTITRWRTNESQPDSRTLLHLATSFDTTIVLR